MRRPGCTLRGCAFLLLLALGPAVARLLHEDASDIEQVRWAARKLEPAMGEGRQASWR